MTTEVTLFPRARIPYGTWGSSFSNRILGLRKVRKDELDYLIIGSTVPWHWKFWNAPLVASCLGTRIPGYHMEQACATGLQAVVLGGAEVDSGAQDVVGVLTFDRTSDSPVGVFPERRAYRRTEVLADVWDNFGFDPATGRAMIACAGRAARKYKVSRSEIDEITARRYEQYFDARRSGFLDRVLVPLELLTVQGRPLGRIEDDLGVREVSLGSLQAMFELDTCVTAGTQTHASDGMAFLLVCTEERARDLSPKPEIEIRFVGKSEVRTDPSLMPEAPAFAVGKLLERVGLDINDISVIKTHNPFAVNDAVFAKVFDHDWSKVNNNGCSLVWGHPQGPTLTRSLIEGLEEAVDLGGGYVLLCGCAAGDVGIAAIFEVSEGGAQ
jgi:acetyl-CoA acetyltransferase